MKPKSETAAEGSAKSNTSPFVGAAGSVVFLSPEHGNPLLSVTDAFLRYTGYERNEVLGRDLAFLNGPETSPEAAEMLSYLLRNAAAGQVKILHYRKDGTSFWHMCDLRPILNADDNITHFICVLRLV